MVRVRSSFLLICGCAPTFAASTYSFFYSYTLGANGSLSTFQDTVSQTNAFSFSKAIAGAGAAASVNGTIDFGTLKLLGVSDVSTTLAIDTQASASATEVFGDTLYFSSATLPAGTAVSYQVTATLHDLFRYSATDPFVASNSCASQDQDTIVMFSSAGQLGDTACARLGTQTVSKIFRGLVGGSAPISGSLAINGRADTFYMANGVSYTSTTDNMTIDAANTAAITVQILTPGVTLLSASGASYADSASTVPEPGTIGLVTMGLVGCWLVRARRVRV